MDTHVCWKVGHISNRFWLPFYGVNHERYIELFPVRGMTVFINCHQYS